MLSIYSRLKKEAYSCPITPVLANLTIISITKENVNFVQNGITTLALII